MPSSFINTDDGKQIKNAVSARYTEEPIMNEVSVEQPPPDQFAGSVSAGNRMLSNRSAAELVKMHQHPFMSNHSRQSGHQQSTHFYGSYVMTTEENATH